MGTIRRAIRVFVEIISADSLVVCGARSSADETPSDPHSGHDMSAYQAVADPHARHHHLIEAPPAVAGSIVSYRTPDVTLVRSDGERVPPRLTECAKRYHAGAQGSFYTGSAEASIVM
jgi:hypothetical protein